MPSNHPLLNRFERLLGSDRFDGMIRWAQQKSLPGFSRIPVYDIILFLYQESRKESITHKVNSLAFSFLLALFPFFLFVFTLIPLLPMQGISERLMQGLQPFIPDAVEPFLFKTLKDVISVPRGGLLSFSFLLALYFSTNATQTMMRGFEKSYRETFRKRNFFQKRIDALRLVFLVALLMIFSVVLLIFGNEIWRSLVLYFSRQEIQLGDTGRAIRFLFLEKWSGWVFTLFQWIISFFLFQSIFYSIFRYGVSLHRKFKFFAAGTTLATVCTILISLIFSAMINRFGSFHLVYGSIGALIIMLIYIQLNCFILVACFELNASIAVNRDIRRAEKYKNKSGE
jgi:membrane protein